MLLTRANSAGSCLLLITSDTWQHIREPTQRTDTVANLTQQKRPSCKKKQVLVHHIVKDIPAYCREVGLDDLEKFFLTQTIL